MIQYSNTDTNNMLPFSIDQTISLFDIALRTISGGARERRPNPSKKAPPIELSDAVKNESGRLMRINHCGEVCAQALYLGQALTSNEPRIREALKKAAEEEIDHLAWCEERLEELDTKRSYLNPAFFAMSFLGGAIAGFLGNRINLGFVAATEEQVVNHLDVHLEILPEEDKLSRLILEKMREDEAKHQDFALEQGGLDFPYSLKNLMKLASRVMTRSTYWL